MVCIKCQIGDVVKRDYFLSVLWLPMGVFNQKTYSGYLPGKGL